MATLPELSLLTCGLVWKQKHTRWLQLLLILAIAWPAVPVPVPLTIYHVPSHNHTLWCHPQNSVQCLLWLPVSGFLQAFWRLGMASLPRLLLVFPLPRTLHGMCHGSRLGWGLATCVIHVASPYSFAFPILFFGSLHKNREQGKQGRPGNTYHMNDVSWTKWKCFPSQTHTRLYRLLPGLRKFEQLRTFNWLLRNLVVWKVSCVLIGTCSCLSSGFSDSYFVFLAADFLGETLY